MTSHKHRGIKKGTGILFVAALFIGAGLGEMLGNSSLGWQMGIGIGLLLVAGLRTWMEKRVTLSSLAFAFVGLYMLLQRFLPENLSSYIARYSYLIVGFILGAVGVGYLLQPDNRDE